MTYERKPYVRTCIICKAPWEGMGGLRCNACQQTELLQQQAQKLANQVQSPVPSTPSYVDYSLSGSFLDWIAGSIWQILLMYVLACGILWWLQVVFYIMGHIMLGVTTWPSWYWIGF